MALGLWQQKTHTTVAHKSGQPPGLATVAAEPGQYGGRPGLHPCRAAYRQHAFTLIELMIVVAIIGLLAVVAVPAFEVFLLRTKVAEGITAARPLQLSVADNAVNGRYLGNGLPPNAVLSGTATFTWTQNLPKAVKSLSLSATTGWITITYSGGPIDNKTILLAPKYRDSSGGGQGLLSTPANGTLIPTGRLSWTCRSADVVGSGGGAVFAVGTVPGRFAPQVCTEQPLE